MRIVTIALLSLLAGPGCGALLAPNTGLSTLSKTATLSSVLLKPGAESGQRVYTNGVIIQGTCVAGATIVASGGSNVTIEETGCNSSGEMYVIAGFSGTGGDRSVTLRQETSTETSAEVTLNYSYRRCQTSYYVRNGGADGGAGTSPATAWATIGKVNGETYAAGDCILFRRGDEFTGATLAPGAGVAAATATSPILFGAYGEGARPIISGADDESGGWGPSGPDFSKGVATQPDDVYVDGVRYDRGTQPGLGANEWDYAGATLYLDSDPGTRVVEVSQRRGVSLGEDNIILEDLHILYASDYGIFGLAGSDNLIVQDSIIEHTGITGIQIGAPNGIVRRNVVRDMRGRAGGQFGINAAAASARIYDNVVYNICSPTLAENCFAILANASGTDPVIERNLVHSSDTGIGMNHSGFIRNNIVYNTRNGIVLNSVTTSGEIRVFNNTVTGTNGGNSISISDLVNTFDVKNNVFVGTAATSYAYDVFAGVTVTEDNNLIQTAGANVIRYAGTPYASGNIAGYRAASGQGANSIEVAPDFYDPAPSSRALDYQPDDDSPLVNAGAEVGVSTDYTGNPRDSSPDIGAFELQSVPACAATGGGTCYYVDATGGNGGNSGLTPELAWASVANVAANAPYSAGDQILFRNGEKWYEALTVSDSGTAANPIVYGAYYGEKKQPAISGGQILTGWTGPDANGEWTLVTGDPFNIYVDGVEYARGGFGTLTKSQWDHNGGTLYIGFNPVNKVIEGGTALYTVVMNGQSGITFDDMEITQAILYGIDTGSVANGNDQTFRNCKFTQNYSGIQIEDGDDILIENNAFLGNRRIPAGNASEGVNIIGTTNRVTVRGNDIQGSYANLRISGTSHTDLLVEKNMIHEWNWGIRAVGGGGNWTFRQNLIWSTYHTGLGTQERLSIGGPSAAIQIIQNSFHQVNDTDPTVGFFSGTATVTMRNNILMKDLSWPFDWDDATFGLGQGVDEYNIFFNDGGANFANVQNGAPLYATETPYRTYTGTGTGTLFIDPGTKSREIRGAYDFLLKNGAASIEHGIDQGLTTDFLGRPISGAPDAGALEK